MRIPAKQKQLHPVMWWPTFRAVCIDSDRLYSDMLKHVCSEEKAELLPTWQVVYYISTCNKKRNIDPATHVFFIKFIR